MEPLGIFIKETNNDEICLSVFKYYLVLSKVGGIWPWLLETSVGQNTHGT